MTATIQVVGDKEVVNMLNKMDKNLTGPITDAVKASGFLVEGSAKRMCPVRTGRLRGSIHTVASRFQATVGTNVAYGPYVEFGTSRQRSQPYLRPALYNNESRIIGVITDAIKKVIKSSTGRFF